MNLYTMQMIVVIDFVYASPTEDYMEIKFFFNFLNLCNSC